MDSGELRESSSREGTSSLGGGGTTGGADEGRVPEPSLRFGTAKRKRRVRNKINIINAEPKPKKHGGLLQDVKAPTVWDQDPKHDSAVRAHKRLHRGLEPANLPEVLPFEASLAYAFRSVGGKRTAIEAARLLIDVDVRFRKLVYAYEVASESDKLSIRLEDLCAAAEIPPADFLAAIVPAMWKRNVDIAKLLAAMAHPEIVAASIDAAKSPRGVQDRKMMHDALGFLPQPKGLQITMDNRHQSVNIEGKESTSGPGLPSFEQDGIEIIQAIRGDASVTTKQLTPPSPLQIIEVPSESDEEVENVPQ
jgi:hypothetical protein